MSRRSAHELKMYTRADVRDRLVEQLLERRRSKTTPGECESILGECTRRIFGNYLLTHISDKQVGELERYIADGWFDRTKARRR